jgi:hypothetical protein
MSPKGSNTGFWHKVPNIPDATVELRVYVPSYNGMFYTSAGLAQRQAVSGEANFSEHTRSERLPPQSFTSTLNPPISYLATQEKLS